MPRRAPPPVAVAPVNTLLPPPPPSPLVQKLRQDYRWASISQFCWTFSDAFGLVDWDIDRLEADFDGDETQVIPDLLVKLLFALTYNRQIKRDNVMEHIRKQYEKRARPCVLGTVEEPVEWAALGLGLKVQILYELCEIQMEDAARFRGLLKSEEDAVSWRIDPVGWDKEGNTYYLFDDNRLWIQRLPPRPPAPARPPKKSTLKAKRAQKRQRQAPPPKTPATKKGRLSKKREDTPPPKVEKVEEPISGARRRTQVSFYGNLTPTVAALKKGATQDTPSTSRSTRSTRGHPVDTKPTLAAAETPSRRGKGKQVETKPASLPRGTRTSRRTRDTEDEWQQVPEEWLDAKASGSKGASGSGSNGTKRKKPVDDDEESELSELTDEEEHDATVAGNGNGQSKIEMDVDKPEANDDSAASSELSELDDVEDPEEGPTPVAEDEDGKDDDFTPGSDVLSAAKEESEEISDEVSVKEDEEEDEDDEAQNGDVGEVEDEVKAAVKEANNLPEGFVEWEAVCVTLYDWRTFPEQFAKSRDPDEKALYTLLTKQVGPTIIAVLVEKLQEIARQEAVLNRKRSSRIATIQLSKEEALRAETAQREMEERMERTRYEETRHEREAAEHARREQERDSRLREREERALAREEAIMAKAREESEKAEQAEKDRQYRAKRREQGFTAVTPTPGDGGNASQADRWELNCEVCKKTGWNVDDDEDVVACEDCGRWQHMKCHDLQDMREGRRKRSWDKVDFRCKECLEKLARRQGTSLPNRPQTHAPRSDANGSATVMHQQAARAPQSAPNHPQQVPHPSQVAHHSQQVPYAGQSPRQGPPPHLNHAPHPGHVSSPSSRPSYPPAPHQSMSPYSQQAPLHPGYPPHGSPNGYPPQSSPRQGGQLPYPQAPYQAGPYGPPSDARSPYQPQQALPHQHRSPYQSGLSLPRQTLPHYPQQLPPQHYPHPHPHRQQPLPPPPQGYPSHPGYPQGHYPSQNPYQGQPPPHPNQVNGHQQQQQQQQRNPYPPHDRAPSGERSGPTGMHNGPSSHAPPPPAQVPRAAEPVHPPSTQG